MGKAGQVTLFIIIAMMIVVGILAVIFFMARAPDVKTPSDVGVKKFVEDCVGEAIEDKTFKVMEGGGRAMPYQYMEYRSHRYNYLCYNADYFLKCYNTHPMLEFIAEAEIRDATKDAVQECFNKLRTDLEAKGYSIEGSSTSYSIDLLPKSIEVNLQKPIVVNRDGTSESYEDFSISIMSPLYDLIRISRIIVNDESQFCNFEYNGFMLLYPDYDIRRIDYDESRLYRVIDRATGYEFKFAVRSCAFAPGV